MILFIDTKIFMVLIISDQNDYIKLPGDQLNLIYRNSDQLQLVALWKTWLVPYEMQSVISTLPLPQL